MAVAGAETVSVAGVVTASPAVGTVLAEVTLPAGAVVVGVDLVGVNLDVGAIPTLAVDLGDASDVDRFLNDVLVGDEATVLTVEQAAYHRYAAATVVQAKVAVGAATFLEGTLSMTVSWYPAVDRDRLQRTVLRELGILSVAETPDAEDAQLADEALGEVHDGWAFRGLAARQDLTWPVTLVPTWAARPYAVTAASRLTGVFEWPEPRQAMMFGRAAEAEKEMRRQTAKKTTGAPVSLEPYLPDPAYEAPEGTVLEDSYAVWS